MHITRNLLVTGGAGFIGSNFVHYWLQAYPGDKVVVLDALTYAGNRSNLSQRDDSPELRFIEGSILDESLVIGLLTEHEIDTIVNFAAETHVDRSIVNPDLFLQTNINGTHTLLKAAKEVWIDGKVAGHRFHQVSTDEIYGPLGQISPPFTEECPYSSSSPYAASKAAADQLVTSYHRTFGVNTTISCCSNNYGPFQHQEKLIPKTIRCCLDQIPIPLYGDGQQVRDWLHVSDHIRALDAIIHSVAAGQTYNIGGNDERNNSEIVQLICSEMDKRLPENAPHSSLIEQVADRPGHDRRYALNTSKIEAELGVVAEIPFESGIVDTIDWYVEHLNRLSA